MASIQGQITNGQIVIELWLSVTDGSSEGRFFTALVDTGATISGVSPIVVSALGLRPIAEQTASVLTPAVRTDVPLFEVFMSLPITRVIDSEEMGNFRDIHSLFNVVRITLIHQSLGMEVLLGMDFLKYCHLTTFGDTFILSN